MKKILALLILLMATATAGFARTDAPTPDAETVTFRFRAGADMFLLKGNEAELTRLYALVDTYREQIADGRMPVYVDGYCTSLPTAKENRRTAYLRASRVKSELVTPEGAPGGRLPHDAPYRGLGRRERGGDRDAAYPGPENRAARSGSAARNACRERACPAPELATP